VRPIDVIRDPIGSLRRYRRQAALKFLQGIWEGQARADPLWAVLSEPSRAGRKWELDEFLLTGERQIAAWLERVVACGVRLEMGTAIDFGCGIGRLTQPLARRFDRAIGIDISPTMLSIARRIDPPRNATFVLSRRDDLSFIPRASADLVVSHITLQHIRPEFTERYIREFFRVTRPGGVIIFTLPSHLVAEEDAGTASAPAVRPAHPDELSEEASRARISLIEGPREAAAGESVALRVSVENAGDAEWRQSEARPLTLGDRWLSGDGELLLVPDDGRTPLPPLLRPGESAVLTLAIRAPATPGRYTLELDVVQEGFRWFHQAGSPSLRIPFVVTPTPAAARASGAARDFSDLVESAWRPAVPFEMHAVRKERVLEIAAECGGRLLALDENVTQWRDYGYYFQAGADAPAGR
jgi:SAM-dependent methyltransferase